ncbi:MAG: purine-nucleoside phosphorylase [Clostridiales bacterium]|jgi:purine-nucleoside phosphorylase|nr:purine-nucleoside phosphorylase [Clostridiales bacterium]
MIPTPHIEAKEGEIAESVLMPGDPLRAKFIAETYLKDAVQYNGVRGMLGFTGTYKGKRVSVQGSGMGMPSIGIYSYELFAFYGVKNIVRIGTAGSINENLKVKDIVIAQGACHTSNFAAQYNLSGTFAPISSFDLLQKTVTAAEKHGAKYMVGNVLSSDAFYGEAHDDMKRWADMGILAVEMESAALFMNAAKLKKNALCMLTISDEIFNGISTTSAERQTAFTAMMEIALEAVTA